MAAGNVSKDSWSRCEPPSMLYDATLRRPNSPQPVKPNFVQKDTIESTQQRLKKEILERLDNKGLELPHESYVAVIQVGKYMFMAVMLPVYLCCYGIPRWFLLNAFPQLLAVISHQFFIVGRFAAKMKKRVNDLMKGILDQLLGNALRMGKESGKNLWKAILLKFERISQHLSKLTKAVSLRSENVKNHAASLSEKIMEQARKNAFLTNRWILSNSQKFANQFLAKVLTGLETFDRVAFTPFVKKILVPFQLLNSVCKQFSKKVKKVTNQVKEVLQPAFSFAGYALEKIVEETKRFYAKIVPPLVEWMLAKKEVLVQALTKLKKIIIDPVTHSFAFIRPYFEPLIDFGKRSFSRLPNGVKRSLKFSKKIIPHNFKEKMKDKRNTFFGSVKNMSRGCYSGCIEMIRFTLKSLGKIWTMMASFVKMIALVLKKIFGYLKILPKKGLQLFIVVLKFVGRIANRILFAFHVVVAVMMIASDSGFDLAKKLSD